MLKSHFDAVENNLLALSRLAANAGHPVHKGMAREAFVKDFLRQHIGESVDVGMGEIIDADSRPGEARHNIDVVLFKRDYPKLDFGGGITGFLAESVVATIEVKSNLTKEELATAMKAAADTKRLKRSSPPSSRAGHIPPAILSYVVAYDGPKKMQTVHSWIAPIYASLKLEPPKWGATRDERIGVPSPALDGVFVLGKGHLYHDNSPIGVFRDDFRKQYPDARWCIVNRPDANLLMLFLILTAAISGLAPVSFDLASYVKNVMFDATSGG